MKECDSTLTKRKRLSRRKNVIRITRSTQQRTHGDNNNVHTVSFISALKKMRGKTTRGSVGPQRCKNPTVKAVKHRVRTAFSCLIALWILQKATKTLKVLEKIQKMVIILMLNQKRRSRNGFIETICLFFGLKLGNVCL